MSSEFPGKHCRLLRPLYLNGKFHFVNKPIRLANSINTLWCRRAIQEVNSLMLLDNCTYSNHVKVKNGLNNLQNDAPSRFTKS